METTEKERVYAYLDNLRDSGVTNMVGASKYLEVEFGFDKSKAQEILANWMASYCK